MLDSILKKLNIDSILITDLHSLRYYTGFTGTTGIAFVTEQEKLFFSDFRYKEQGKKEVEQNNFKFVEVSRNSINEVAKIAKNLGVSKMGFEGNQTTYSFYNNLKEEFDSIELISVENELIYPRMIKNDYEISEIKKACKISDTAFAETIKIIKEGMTEQELAGYLEYIQRKNGGEGVSFETIIASGYRSAMPHGVASNKKINKEEFIKFDFGTFYNGYVSDMTRTIYFGNSISEKHKEIYNIVLESQLLALSHAKEGISCRDLDNIAREYISSKGYGDKFGHGLGHGIGLEIHEQPYLSPRSDIILKENMIVTIEPGIYIEGFGGVRIEDDIVIKKDVCEILNNTTKDLIVVE